MATKCTICNAPLMGHPDADVTCADCEVRNFAGDALRYPPRPARGTHAAWDAPRHDGLRALPRPSGWAWTPQYVREEDDHAH